jgi:hypothetical protein
MQSDQITYASTITEQERLFGRCPVVADIVKGGSAADDGKTVDGVCAATSRRQVFGGSVSRFCQRNRLRGRSSRFVAIFSTWARIPMKGG